MRISRQALSVRHAASADELRVAINGVRFEDNGQTLIATDGRMLALVERPEGKTLPASRLPFKEDCEEGPELSPCTIAARGINHVLGSMPRGRTDDPLTNGRILLIDNETTNNADSARFIVANGGKHVIEVEKTEALFPDYQEIIQTIQTSEPVAQVALNVARLETTCKIISEFVRRSGPRNCGTVKVQFRGVNVPVQFSLENRETGEILKVALMQDTSP